MSNDTVDECPVTLRNSEPPVERILSREQFITSAQLQYVMGHCGSAAQIAQAVERVGRHAGAHWDAVMRPAAYSLSQFLDRYYRIMPTKDLKEEG